MTLSEFFFNTPIYTPISMSDAENYKMFLDISSNTYPKKEFEGYNPWKQVDSTFVVYSEAKYLLKTDFYDTVQIKCKRTDTIFYYYLLSNHQKKTITKIGQYPSVADFHISEIKQYSKLLSNEKLREFTRAIGLAANGVGIGSFVYLRRIFEYLIHEAFAICKEDGVINEEEFKRARMDQKIELLSTHLPDFLVSHKSMYSILSKGIHELNEETCLKHFDTLRVGIEIILDEKLDEQKKKIKIQEAKKRIASLQV